MRWALRRRTACGLGGHFPRTWAGGVACDPPRDLTQGHCPDRLCAAVVTPRSRDIAPRVVHPCGYARPSPEGRPTTATHAHRICGIRHTRHCASGSGDPGSLHIRADGESPMAMRSERRAARGQRLHPPRMRPSASDARIGIRRSPEERRSPPFEPGSAGLDSDDARPRGSGSYAGPPALSGTFGQLCAGVSFQPVMCACGRVPAAFARPGVFDATGG